MYRLLDKFLHSAWEPFTPRGVAAFTRAPLGRLLFVHLLMAIFGGVVVAWFVSTAWIPVVHQAIHRLPKDGDVSHAELIWHGDSPVRLAGNDFLSLAVDIRHEGGLSREAQIAIEFARADVRCHSLLGYVELQYPPNWLIPANHPGLEPWWNSREPWLLAGLGAATMLWLLVSWLTLATVYSFIVWLIAFFANRNLDWAGSWKLSGAALMPGALFMCLWIMVYGLDLIGLIQLGFGFAFHLVIGWIYLLVSPVLLPRHPDVAKAKANPFSAE